MPQLVYILCTLTCLVCALLLGAGYARTKAGLLFWACLCFIGLTINNLLVFLDIVVLPYMDLGPARDWTALGSMALLVFGLIWSAD